MKKFKFKIIQINLKSLHLKFFKFTMEVDLKFTIEVEQNLRKV